ncbi:hypothetical protein K8Q95_27440 [Escherichia coli]|uniref:hypothetical protein n=1 Tax=Escherichia coli TaxID=562 RepID=UPI0031864679
MRDIQKEIEEIKLRNIANELAGLPLEPYPDELPATAEAENAPVAVHEPVDTQTTITSTETPIESHTEADLSWDDMIPEQDSESDYVRPKRTREERLAILAKVNGKSKPAGSQPNPNAAKIKRFQKDQADALLRLSTNPFIIPDVIKNFGGVIIRTDKTYPETISKTYIDEEKLITLSNGEGIFKFNRNDIDITSENLDSYMDRFLNSIKNTVNSWSDGCYIQSNLDRKNNEDNQRNFYKYTYIYSIIHKVNIFPLWTDRINFENTICDYIFSLHPSQQDSLYDEFDARRKLMLHLGMRGKLIN